MGVDQLIALVTFVAVGSGSPGPNNTLLLASGAGFGFRRTVPHVIGTAVGISLLVVIAAAGAAAVVTAAPGVEFVMKVLASAYLLYLAFRLAGGVAVDRVSTPEPFSLPRGAAFQVINPKGWFFAFAVVAGFTPSERSLFTDAISLGIIACVVAATAAGWALGGSALSRALATDRARRVAGVVLGLLLVGSVVLLWV